MLREVQIRITPEELAQEGAEKRAAAHALGVDSSRIFSMELLRRSIDARRKRPAYLLRYAVSLDEPPQDKAPFEPRFKEAGGGRPVVIVGCGPAGLFAALKLLELGLKPIVLERGKEVRSRRKDVAAISKGGEVNPDSNFCFGEGGAGTFSDGKLYTRSTKRGDVREVLELLVYHGADKDILVDAHPHIGTNKLPGVVAAITETIRRFGGEVLFGERVTELEISGGGVRRVRSASGLKLETSAVVLAAGHSARDIFSLLDRSGLALEAKPFALGVRVEHQQALIDEIQYGRSLRHPLLPPASYSFRAQASGRGVFSFCMCPGGIICPAATAPGEIVVNGWSPSKRNSRFANSGIVVEVSAEDLQQYDQDPVWAGVSLQRAHEQRAYELGGGNLAAPAQRLTDFLADKTSAVLPECSYHPGVSSVRLSELFLPEIYSRLQQALKEFGRRAAGYLTYEAIVVAAESRTSSPVRIPRLSETLMHPQADGLFPCGEGAGYAGGIMSAAIDGMRVAEAANSYFLAVKER